MTLDDLYFRCYKDLNLFRRYIQMYDADDKEKLPPADFHKRWGQELLFGKESIAVEGFRECGKSSIIKAFLLHCLTYPVKERSYICIMRGNKTSASKIIKEISSEYRNNPLMHKASLKVIREDSAECFCVETISGVIIRIEAYGKGSAIRGASFMNRRPDVIIMDDIQDKDEMRSPTIPDTDWDWFLSDIKFLGKSSRFFLIGNNLGEKCIIERLLASADADNVGLFGFVCYRIPALIGDKPSWEERFTAEYLDQEKQEMAKIGKLDVWLMERMCLSISDETRIFRREDFQYFIEQQQKEILDRSKLYLFSDLASSSKDTSDYRVLMLIAVDERGYWYIIDCKYGRWQATEYLDIMFDFVRKYELLRVYPEDGQILQTLQSVIKQRQREESCYFSIEPIKHNKLSKEARIEMLQPRFRAGTIWFRAEADYLGELEAELLAFTVTGSKGLHDDLADCLSFGLDIITRPHRQESKHRYVELGTGGQML